MSTKRVTDVSEEYDEASKPAKDAEIHRIKKGATALKMGKLETDVDAVLATEGLALSESLTPKTGQPRLRRR